MSELSSEARMFLPRLERLEQRTLLSIFAAGGSPGHVEVFNASGGAKLADFEPYNLISGKLNLATGDFNKDGVKDLVVATDAQDAVVKVFNGQHFLNGTFDDSNPDASVFAQGFVYGTNFDAGANVAAGDVDQDGFVDLITGASVGNPHVKVFDGEAIFNGTFHNQPDNFLLASFFAYGLQFNVGANVAAGDVTNDGFADIITGANVGNPHVKVYSGAAIANGQFNNNPEANVVASYFPYALQFNVGVTVATGDTNGDTFVDIITGASTGNPDVRTYNGQAIAQGTFNNNPSANQLTQFFAYSLQNGIGVRVASLNFDGGSSAEILTGNTLGSGILRLFAGNASGVNPPSILEKTFGDDFFRDGISVA